MVLMTSKAIHMKPSTTSPVDMTNHTARLMIPVLKCCPRAMRKHLSMRLLSRVPFQLPLMPQMFHSNSTNKVKNGLIQLIPSFVMYN